MNLLSASGVGSASLVPLLTDHLTPQFSPAVQEAAAGMIATIDSPAAQTAILDHWSSFTPAIRTQVFDIIQSKPRHLEPLLDAIAAGKLHATDLDAVQRQRLLSHKDAAVRKKAESAFAGAVDANRDKVVKQYLTSISTTGEVAHGRQVFQKTCTPCHQLEGQGLAVGPDLAAVTTRSAAFFIESIFDPNRAVDERYQSYTALTADGRTHAGMLAGETSTSVTMLEQQGKRTTLLRADLESFVNSGKSLMPEGLERDLTPQDAGDLVAYLLAQRPPVKQFAGNKPAVVVPDKGGVVSLLATNCEIYGNHIVFEAPYKNIGYWDGAGDHVAWNVNVPAPGQYDVYLDWACEKASAGSAATLEGPQPAVEFETPSTGDYDHYQTKRVGRAILSAGANRLILRPSEPLTKPNLMDLHALYLIPEGVPAQPVLKTLRQK
jgi:putative heme-binding domain-containing protein